MSKLMLHRNYLTFIITSRGFISCRSDDAHMALTMTYEEIVGMLSVLTDAKSKYVVSKIEQEKE